MKIMQEIRSALRAPIFWVGLVISTVINTFIFYQVFNR